MRNYKRKRPAVGTDMRLALAVQLRGEGMSLRAIAREIRSRGIPVTHPTVISDLARAGVTEENFQASVIDMCKLYGIAWYHPYASRHSMRGWPDLALCGTRGFITRELKTETGNVTPHQQRWGHLLRQAGISWDVWRPGDLRSGRIQRELIENPLTRRLL